MATRFYFSSTDPVAGVNPNIDVSWNSSAGSVRRKMSPTKDSSAATDIAFFNGGNIGANGNCLAVQFVSDPLAAGNVIDTGTTFKCYIRCQESANNDNINRQGLSIQVCNIDGSIIRSNPGLFNHYGPNTTEWVASPTTATSKTFADGDSMNSSYTTVAGDRLVLEVGGIVSGAGGTSVTGHMIIGSDSGSDLAENETGTSGNPWFEISTNITFLPGLEEGEEWPIVIYWW